MMSLNDHQNHNVHLNTPSIEENQESNKHRVTKEEDVYGNHSILGGERGGKYIYTRIKGITQYSFVFLGNIELVVCHCS